MTSRSLSELNSQCENAMIDKPFHDHSTTWVEEHKSLFDQVEIFIKQNEILLNCHVQNKDDLAKFIYPFYTTYLACINH
jgi:hypothetical protein